MTAEVARDAGRRWQTKRSSLSAGGLHVVYAVVRAFDFVVPSLWIDRSIKGGTNDSNGLLRPYTRAAIHRNSVNGTGRSHGNGTTLKYWTWCCVTVVEVSAI